MSLTVTLRGGSGGNGAMGGLGSDSDIDSERGGSAADCVMVIQVGGESNKCCR